MQPRSHLRLVPPCWLPLCHLAASVARKLYMRQGMGVGLFRTQYGGRNKRRGSKPEFQSKASGGCGLTELGKSRGKLDWVARVD